MISRSIAILAAGALALTLSGCTDGTSYPQETAEGYFSAIFSNDPTATLGAAEFSVPGSNAEKYAIEQSAYKQSMLDGGFPDTTKYELIFKPDSIISCPEGVDLNDPKQVELCPTYSNLQFDGDKLANFDTRELSLDGRITVGDGTAIPIGDMGSAKFIAAYESMAGELVIILEVTSNTSELTSRTYDAIYVSSSGRQMELSSSEGPDSLKQGRTGNISFVFTSAKLGGNLEATFYDADYNEVPISIPTK